MVRKLDDCVDNVLSNYMAIYFRDIALQTMLKTAKSEFGNNISPCWNKTYHECIGYLNGKVVFAFNDANNNTKGISINLNN